MALTLLWEQCIAAFLKDVFVSHSNSEATVDSYAYVLRSFLRHTGKAPEQATREDVVSFMAAPNVGRRNHGMPPSPGTRNLRKVVVNQFYEFAGRYKVIDPYGKQYRLFQGENPAAGIHQAKLERRTRYLSEEEVRRFFSVIPRTVRGLRDRALFLLYLTTARRRSEIANMMWGDIEYGTIDDEHGSRRGWVYHWRGKGRGGQDDVAELPEVARLAIWEYLEASGRMNTIEPDDPLFVAMGPANGGLALDPYARLSNTSIHRLVKHYAELAGLDPAKVTIHAWRHTSVRYRYELGQDIRSLQRLLRHSNLATTDVYLRSMTITADPEAQLLMERFGNL